MNYASILAVLAMVAGTPVRAQQAPSSDKPAASDPAKTTTPVTDEGSDEIIKLTPFEVSAGSEQGYNAATTLAGNRLNTELRDIGNAVSVVTKQFLQDTGAVDNKSLLQYLPSGEVGSVYGNFAGVGDGSTPDESGKFVNPNQNTRVRGLTSADNTRDFFLTNIPWDGYNIDRVDFQRGPNSILFGQGSPAGIINASTQPASYKDSGTLELRLGSFGSTRQSLNVNKVILPNELSLRVALLRNDEQYKQDPAYSLDKRFYAATRWEPRWLNRGSARTIFKANIEFGNVKSNNPRDLPPFDNITPWFFTGTYVGNTATGAQQTYNYLNRATFNAVQLQDDNTGLPNHGQMRPSLNNNNLASIGLPSGSPSPWFNPWVGNFGQQFGSPLFLYNNTSSTLQRALLLEPNNWWGIDATGATDHGVLPYMRPGGVNTYSGYAKAARLPFWDYGLYKDKTLTDPSVFNYYKNLLDGPTKNEWQNFRTYNMSLAQTFFDDQLGIEAVYNSEWYKGGREGLLSDWKQGISIDIMNVLSDGTAAPGLINQSAIPANNPGPYGMPFSNGTPNPNVGRPYVTDNAAGSSYQNISNRESGRVTAFARHDFTRDTFLPKIVGRVLGSHTVTGLWSEDRSRNDNRSWQRFGTDVNYKAFVGGTPTTINFNDNIRTPNPVIYLGPSLADRTTAAGANIPRIMDNISMPQTVNMYLFDSHWNAPASVSPGALWLNGYYPADQTQRNGVQADNPANYVGWVNKPVNTLDSDTSQAVRDYLTTSARLEKSVVKSKALVWQGHLWNNFLVGTGGIRKDTAQSWSTSTDTNMALPGDKTVQLNPQFYHLQDNFTSSAIVANGVSVAPTTGVTVTSKSWSMVAHVSDIVPNDLPVRLSLFYARSSNFQPFSNRVDVYGHPIGAPAGKTKEVGVLIETRNGDYSLKIDKYRTDSTNQSSTALGGTWFIGASQAWAGNWVNRFEFNWTNDTIGGAVPNPDPTNSLYNYGTAPGEDLAAAQKREASVISAWRAWQKSVNPDFYKAWNINLNDPTKAISASNPAGFSVTEDSVSKGYEIELNAKVTRNWRLMFNVSKTDASRNNIGGAALTDFISKYETALAGGAPGSVGDLRIWWGGAGNETTMLQWNNNIGSEYHQRKLQEGTNVPELRKWRYNLITNYDFDHGMLKGVGVGGGLRWQSDIVIGYAPMWKDANNHSKGITYDLANPYRGPAETSVDLWASYSHRLTAKIEWVVQLNIRNANNGGDALIPVNSQPTSFAGATYRIRPPRTWQLSNTFKF